MTAANAARAALLLPIGLVAGCAGEPNIEIRAGIDECHECHMVIDQVNQASGFVLDREFVTFDSPGCLLRSYESLTKEERPQPQDLYFADYRDGSLHTGEHAAFLLTSHIPTVMNARVITFSERGAAEQALEHADELVTDWIGYRTTRGTPNVTLDLMVGSNGIEPELVEVSKDDLVLLRVTGNGLTDDLALAIRGYTEVKSITVPADGETVELRVLASRPGAGFPIVGPDGQALGMMRVVGAHTVDEEAN